MDFKDAFISEIEKISSGIGSPSPGITGKKPIGVERPYAYGKGARGALGSIARAIGLPGAGEGRKALAQRLTEHRREHTPASARRELAHAKDPQEGAGTQNYREKIRSLRSEGRAEDRPLSPAATQAEMDKKKAPGYFMGRKRPEDKGPASWKPFMEKLKSAKESK